MAVRRATVADRETMRELYREFFAEIAPPPETGVVLDEVLAEVDELVNGEIAFLAEVDGVPAGFALGRRKKGTRGRLTDLYVRPEARRRGLGAELAHAVAAALRDQGATHLVLDVAVDNEVARAVYDRWGLRPHLIDLIAPIEQLEQRLVSTNRGSSFGSVHAQTDDVAAVARAVRQFVPRLPGHSEGTVVAPPRNGWVAVYDELCDREPPLLQRLARELSDRMGAVALAIGIERGEVVHFNLFERGRSVDEYLSVPTYYGDVAPGDVVALGANPTVVARLTGADRQRFRAVARTAASPSDLPPAPELLAALVQEMKIEGATHGYAGAGNIQGAIQC